MVTKSSRRKKMKSFVNLPKKRTGAVVRECMPGTTGTDPVDTGTVMARPWGLVIHGGASIGLMEVKLKDYLDGAAFNLVVKP